MRKWLGRRLFLVVDWMNLCCCYRIKQTYWDNKQDANAGAGASNTVIVARENGDGGSGDYRYDGGDGSPDVVLAVKTTPRRTANSISEESISKKAWSKLRLKGRRENRCCFFKPGFMLTLWKYRKPHFLTPYIGPSSIDKPRHYSYHDMYVLDLLNKRRLWSGNLKRDFRFYVNNEHHLFSIWRYAKGHPFDSGNRLVKEFVKLAFCFMMSEIMITKRTYLNGRRDDEASTMSWLVLVFLIVTIPTSLFGKCVIKLMNKLYSLVHKKSVNIKRLPTPKNINQHLQWTIHQFRDRPWAAFKEHLHMTSYSRLEYLSTLALIVLGVFLIYATLRRLDKFRDAHPVSFRNALRISRE
jgi:hypothetical protein